jgi:hypothetical protein
MKYLYQFWIIWIITIILAAITREWILAIFNILASGLGCILCYLSDIKEILKESSKREGSEKE